jgi:hypothetical protein
MRKFMHVLMEVMLGKHLGKRFGGIVLKMSKFSKLTQNSYQLEVNPGFCSNVSVGVKNRQGLGILCALKSTFEVQDFISTSLERGAISL